MNPRCPDCGRDVPLDDVNVARDVALCRACGGTFSFADLLGDDTGSRPAADAADPPRGAWSTPTFDGFQVGTSTRSPFAFFIVPFMGVWSGGSLGGIYGQQIASGRFNLMMSLIGIPFILGTVCLGTLAMMTICGRVVVSVAGDEGKVFTGVGPIGWTRRFAWSDVATIREFSVPGSKGGRSPALALEGTTRLVFGTGLNEPRRYFLRQVLRQKLRERYASSKQAAPGDWSA